MEIKTRIPRYGVKDVSSYINKPVLDKFSRIINLRDNVITDNDDSKVIGVIKNAEIIEDKIELTLELFDNKIKQELFNGELVSISMS